MSSWVTLNIQEEKTHIEQTEGGDERKEEARVWVRERDRLVMK